MKKILSILLLNILTLNVLKAQEVPPTQSYPIAIDINKISTEDIAFNLSTADFDGIVVTDPCEWKGIQFVMLKGSGVLSLNGVNLIEQQQINVADIDKIVFTPYANVNGDIAYFKYLVLDNCDQKSRTEGTYNINLTSVNDAPIFNEVEYEATFVNTAIDVNIAKQISDIDGDTEFTYSVTSQGALGSATFNSSTLTYTPTTNALGVDTIDISVADLSGGTVTGIIKFVIYDNQADLSVSSTLSNPNVDLNTDFTYTVSIENKGTGRASDPAIIEIPIDNSLIHLDNSESIVLDSENKLIWNVPSLAIGAKQDLVINLNSGDKIGVKELPASITNASFEINSDNNYFANSVNVLPPSKDVDLMIDMSTDRKDMLTGYEYTFDYKIFVTNNSSLIANDAEVKLVLPDSVFLQKTTYSTGSDYFDNNTSTLTWKLNVVKDAIDSIIVTVYSLKPQTINQQVEIMPNLNDVDIDYSNNTAYVRKQILAEYPLDDIRIPNGFTPNGDGINDTWKIYNLDRHDNIDLKIVTREGKRIYNVKNYDGSWDGEGLPKGTYYYMLTLTRRDGTTQYKKGFVTIIR